MKRRGFTLIETLISLLISTIILSALASIFVLMARALPDDSSSLARSNQLTRAIDRFSFDISWATEITRASASSVELAIPDMSGDGNKESVVWEWGGPGKSWTRTLNGAAPETICPAVNSLLMTWRYRRVAGTTVVKTLENVRVEIASTNAGAAPVISTISAASHARIP